MLVFSPNQLVPFGRFPDAFWLSSFTAALVKRAAISCNWKGALTAEEEERVLPQDNLTAIDELKKSANKLGLKNSKPKSQVANKLYYCDTWYLLVLSTEVASCHSVGVWKFEVTVIIVRKSCAPLTWAIDAVTITFLLSAINIFHDNFEFQEFKLFCFAYAEIFTSSPQIFVQRLKRILWFMTQSTHNIIINTSCRWLSIIHQNNVQIFWYHLLYLSFKNENIECKYTINQGKIKYKYNTVQYVHLLASLSLSRAMSIPR